MAKHAFEGLLVPLSCCAAVCCGTPSCRAASRPPLLFCVLAGDPAAALQDLHHSMSLSQQLGETTGDADTLGELADMYAELGDLETAGRFYG